MSLENVSFILPSSFSSSNLLLTLELVNPLPTELKESSGTFVRLSWIVCIWFMLKVEVSLLVLGFDSSIILLQRCSSQSQLTTRHDVNNLWSPLPFCPTWWQLDRSSWWRHDLRPIESAQEFLGNTNHSRHLAKRQRKYARTHDCGHYVIILLSTRSSKVTTFKRRLRTKNTNYKAHTRT